MKRLILTHLKRAHQTLMFDAQASRKPSPWFGELFVQVEKQWRASEQSDPPSRELVFQVLQASALSYRMSGDYSEDYRTVYCNPTEFDVALMKRLTSRRLAVVEHGQEDLNQIPLF